MLKLNGGELFVAKLLVMVIKIEVTGIFIDLMPREVYSCSGFTVCLFG